MALKRQTNSGQKKNSQMDLAKWRSSSTLLGAISSVWCNVKTYCGVNVGYGNEDHKQNSFFKEVQI